MIGKVIGFLVVIVAGAIGQIYMNREYEKWCTWYTVYSGIILTLGCLWLFL